MAEVLLEGLVGCPKSSNKYYERAKADSSLTTPKLKNVWGPVRSE
jgi:hypothetical protein